MFRCYFCGQVTPPKTTRHTVVIATREKNYKARYRPKTRGGFRGRDESPQDRGGSGVEIRQEVASCPACAAKQHEIAHEEAVVETTPTPETESET